MHDAVTEQALQTALAHHQRGRFADAEKIYRDILARSPNDEALHLLGLLLGQAGQPQAAVDLIQKAIALRPRATVYHINLAKFLTDLRRPDEAIAACHRALALDPHSAEAFNNQSVAQKNKGDLENARQSCQSALALNPRYAEAHINLGNILCASGSVDQAIASYQQALSINSGNADAHLNLGIALHSLGRLDDAANCHAQALRLRPNFAQAYNQLGITQSARGEIDAAVASFRQAMQHNPADPQFSSNLLFAMCYDPAATPQTILEESRNWSLRHEAPLQKFIRPHACDRNPSRPLRVGLVSPDFRAHPVGRFLEALFNHHDPQHMQLHCFSDVPHPDSLTLSLRARADSWHNIAGLSDSAVADLIRSQKIDILIDLAGHTAGNRLPVFAQKPAPLQINYLGYPATTGLSAIDFRITDSFADPPGLCDTQHTEKRLRLPATAWCFSPPPDSPQVQSPLAGQPLRFGSFNNFSKINPPLLDLWAKLLAAVPDSRLALKSLGLSSPSVAQALRAQFAHRSIDPTRIEILDWEKGANSHLAQYANIDIALDTFPYHGTTTTCEALWMGVPVITLAGDSHRSRVGVSLLSQIGLQNCIARTAAEYISIAAALAANSHERKTLRSTLRSRMHKSSLMNAPRFTQDFESALQTLWQIHSQQN